MTPEERFTRIENFLNAAAEHHASFAEHIAQHDKDIKELRQIHKGLAIVVRKIGEAQRVTDEQLKALIATVDRIVRRSDEIR